MMAGQGVQEGLGDQVDLLNQGFHVVQIFLRDQGFRSCPVAQMHQRVLAVLDHQQGLGFLPQDHPSLPLVQVERWAAQ